MRCLLLILVGLHTRNRDDPGSGGGFGFGGGFDEETQGFVDFGGGVEDGGNIGVEWDEDGVCGESASIFAANSLAEVVFGLHFVVEEFGN